MAASTTSYSPARGAPVTVEASTARVLRGAPIGATHHRLGRPSGPPGLFSQTAASTVELPRNGADLSPPSAKPGSAPMQAALDAYAASAAPAPAIELAEANAKAGYQAGFDEGLRAGADAARDQAQEAVHALEAQAEVTLREARQELRATFKGAVGRVDALARALHDEVAQRLEDAEEDLLALCHEVVTRILGDAAVRPEVLRTLLRHASHELRGRPLVAVHLHPDDLELLRQGASGDIQSLGLDDNEVARKVEWVASDQVVLGGVVLHSPEGGLDARLETQLDALRQTLLQNRAARKTRQATVEDAGATSAQALSARAGR